jgi:hypothetical protein
MPSHMSAVQLFLTLDCLFLFPSVSLLGHGQMAVVIAISWWRELLGDEFGGARWSVGVVVVFGGWEKSLSEGRHR